MTAEIVNLRRARKDRARSEKAAKAAENRIAFGRSRSERDTTECLQEQAERRLDGHRLHADDESHR